MKNTLKKLTAIISSITICAVSAVSLSSSAMTTIDYADGFLEDVIATFGEDAYVNYTVGSYNNHAFIINPDCSSYSFDEICEYTAITLKEGMTLPIDELETEYEIYVHYSEDRGYYVRGLNVEKRKKCYEILKTYEAVQALDEYYTVTLSRPNSWYWYGINFDTELSNEEILAMFPELPLTREPICADGRISESYLEENPSFFLFDIEVESMGEIFEGLPVMEDRITEDIYKGMKKLADSGIAYDNYMTSLDSTDLDYQEGSVNVYDADAPAETTTTTTTTTPSEITTTTTITEAATETTAAETETSADTTTAEATTTTKAAATTAKATTKTSTSSPKTGDSGLTGVFLAGTGAIALAVVLRKRRDD